MADQKNLQMSRDLALCARHGIPSLFAFLGDIVSTGISQYAISKLMVANLDLSNVDTKLNAWQTEGGKYYAAEALIRKLDAIDRQMTEPARIACKYGLLVDLRHTLDFATDNMVTNARAEVMLDMRSYHLSNAMLQNNLTRIMVLVKNTPPQSVVSGKQAMRYIPGWQEDLECPMQKYVFFQHFLQVFPPDMFTNQETADVYQALQMQNVYVDMAEINIDCTLNPAVITAYWKTADEEFILGAYDFLGAANPIVVKNNLLAATTVLISSREKSKSNNWVTSRVRSIMQNIPGINLTNLVTCEILENFQRMYPNYFATPESLYERIIVLYTMMQKKDIPQLQWILEQAAFGEVISATLIAEVVRKMSYFNVEILLSSGLAVAEITNLLTLFRELMRFPYASLINVPVTKAKYPTIAYICLYTSKVLMKNVKLANYLERPDSNCNMAKVTMNKIATSMFKIAQEIGNPETDNATLSKYFFIGKQFAHLNQENYREYVLLKQGFAIDNLTDQEVIRLEQLRQVYEENRGVQAAQGVAAPAQHQQQEGPDHAAADAAEARAILLEERDAQNNLKQLKKAGWNRAARALPNNAQQLTLGQIANRLKASLSPRAEAFNYLCERIFDMTRQTANQVIAKEDTDIPSPYKQLDNNIVRAMSLWGVTVNPDWTRPNRDNLNGVNINRYKIEPRAIAVRRAREQEIEAHQVILQPGEQQQIDEDGNPIGP